MNFTPNDPRSQVPPGYRPPSGGAQYNEMPYYRPPGRPTAAKYLLWAILCAATVALLPEIGLISYGAMCSATVYLVSARAPAWAYLFPVAGVALLFFRFGFSSDPVTLAVMYTVLAAILSAVAAGAVICRRDGDFHRALLTFTAVAAVLAMALAALAVHKYSLTAEGVCDRGAAYLISAIDRVSSLNPEGLTAEELSLLRGEAPALVRTVLYYLPAVTVILIELCGVVSIRFAGLIHDLNNTAYYHPARRAAQLDPIFAVLFFASVAVTLVGGAGIVGFAAGNVMLILLIPAVAAGVSAYRQNLLRRRAEGKRTGAFPVIIIIAVALYIPALALYIPAVYGCVAALKKKKKE